ncbi:MAG TPA: 2-dehydropantoate 2-reductase [Alcanivoracaceae bacterium]|nr:2-dehydropantoate 2-reductase [Alcanivoracaceae bacterium]
MGTLTNKKALIIGAGAIGSFYGALLHKVGWQVSVVARSDASLVAEQGYQFESPLGDISWRPHKVYSNENNNEKFDYVVLCTKVLPSLDRAALLKPWVSDNTTIVLIQNGIEIEAPVLEAFPNNPLLSCLAFIAVTRVAPGKIVHKAFGRLKIGGYPHGNREVAQPFADALSAAGVAADVSEDIVYERWLKCVWNTPFNPASILANGADTMQMLEAPGGEAFIKTLMAEVVRVAAAAGYDLPADVVEANIAGTRAMPAYRNSMAIDYLHQRDTETEAILGNVVAVAKKHGVSVPHLETMWALIQIRNEPPRVSD